jgi:AIG2-like family
VVWGVVFEIDPAEKASLDRHEGLGDGYIEKQITVTDVDCNKHSVFMYAAERSHIDAKLAPYFWYKRFFVEGARQHRLPMDYINALEAVGAIGDPVNHLCL